MNEGDPLVFALEVGPESWVVQGPVSPPHRVANPIASENFRGLVGSLRDWAGRPVPLDRPDPLQAQAFVEERARRVSAKLTSSLLADEQDRRAVLQALVRCSRARIVIRVRSMAEGWDLAADAALALPWELLAPEEPGSFPVREGRLVVLREAVAEGAPELPEPTGPFTLAVTLAAPEDRAAFAYEQEAFRLIAALSPLGQRAVFSDLGGLGDLIDLVADIQATAIHFRGQGLPGGLLFENHLGFAEEVPAAELRRRLATVLLDSGRIGAFPGLFFLAAPYTARSPASKEVSGTLPFDTETSAAAALHRTGFAQVVGYFGPVSEELRTRLEERFYAAIAAGMTVLAAVEEAREVLLDPVKESGERVWYPFGWCQLAVYHRGRDRPLAAPGRGARLPARFRRKVVQVNGLPVLERGFIGRRGLLHEIRRRLYAGQRLLVLQGLGGLGKTALASYLLKQTLAADPRDRLILRCQEVEGIGNPMLALRGQAEEHGHRYRFRLWDETIRNLRERFPDPAEGFLEAVRALRRHLPKLVIYADNAESLQAGPRNNDPSTLGTWKTAALPFWHALRQLDEESDEPILITTRYLWSDLVERAWIGVGPMERADSLRLADSLPALQKLPREHRMRIAERVDGHPRTLEYLDRLVERQRRTLGRKRVRDAWAELVEPVLPEQTDQITADLLLEEIWRRLSRRGRSHARRLSVLIHLAPPFVIDRLGTARDELIRSGLLTRFRQSVITGEGWAWFIRWGFHSLVKENISRKTSAEQRRAAHRAVGEAFELWMKKPDASRGEQWQGVYHFQAVGEVDRAWPMVLDLALWCRHRAFYQYARDILEEFIMMRSTGEPLALAFLLLCDIRHHQGESDAASLELLDHAWDQAETEQTRGLILAKRGNILLSQARYEEAETALRSSMEILEPILEREDPDLLFTWSSLAEAVERRGRFKEAEELLMQVNQAWERSDPTHPEHAASLKTLADVLLQQGHYREAEIYLRKALALQENILEEDHPAQAATIHTLAETLRLEGNPDEAETLLRGLIAQDERRQRTTHPTHAMTLAVLGELLVEEDGDPEEAEALLRRALALSGSHRGDEHPESASILHSLGFLFYTQERYEEAERLLRQAIAIFETTSGQGHLDISGLLMTLAQVIEQRGQGSEAEELLRKTLEETRERFGETYPGCASLLAALSQLLQRQERYEEAEQNLRKALEITEVSLGRMHRSFITRMKDLAVLVDLRGRTDESRLIMREIQALENEGIG